MIDNNVGARGLERIITSLFIVVAFSHVTCGTQKVFEVGTGVVNLGIKDSAWDPNRPDLSVGWCGETSIQQAMAYYGVEVSQSEVNNAGNPEHADLYAQDIDTALDNLDVEYVVFDSTSGKVDDFLDWIREQLDLSRPVFCGLKIYPDQHPNWALDHFVLAVGYQSGSLLLNTQTDCDGQVWLSTTQLTSDNEGYSFENKHHLYFGRSIVGVHDKAL